MVVCEFYARHRQMVLPTSNQDVRRAVFYGHVPTNTTLISAKKYGSFKNTNDLVKNVCKTKGAWVLRALNHRSNITARPVAIRNN